MKFGNYNENDGRVWSCELGQISCGVSAAMFMFLCWMNWK